ncbi:hypothetical protein GF312_05700 [Candidatus Poribacteria bacterium]|nr:hypothetical protein [Candidatus Poribacteria bacterium]
MIYRKLGRTGVDIGIIGMGTEYLNGLPPEDFLSIVSKAIEYGVNYIDIFFAHPEFRDKIGAALKGKRDKVIIAGHLGSAARKDGQYYKTRDPEITEGYYLDFLKRLDMEYADIIMLHNVDEEKEYEEVMDSALKIAQKFQKEGKARFIGMSAHRPKVATKAIESGIVDVLMYPVNFTTDAMPGRKELLSKCSSNGVGLVAMKPYAGGKLLQKGSIHLEHYQSGWESMKKDLPNVISPIQCLSYTLSQIGVCTAIPGVKNISELDAALHYLEAADEEKDFSSVIKDFAEYTAGECVYCNHCLPCPSKIDIGQTMRLLDLAQHAMSDEILALYEELDTKASDCVECGSCVKRCPFEVDVIPKMKEAVELFGD